ncbi:uncharacterized protein [Triticum aestivum]|uniref:uncharacterized protein n=1 Tax=Triticum aestivum TaxID=4565 RepID=UPI001D01BB9F|nr:uncharacterized protein LOC123191697 [Triticum aestivum]
MAGALPPLPHAHSSAGALPPRGRYAPSPAGTLPPCGWRAPSPDGVLPPHGRHTPANSPLRPARSLPAAAARTSSIDGLHQPLQPIEVVAVFLDPDPHLPELLWLTCPIADGFLLQTVQWLLPLCLGLPSPPHGECPAPYNTHTVLSPLDASGLSSITGQHQRCEQKKGPVIGHPSFFIEVHLRRGHPAIVKFCSQSFRNPSGKNAKEKWSRSRRPQALSPLHGFLFSKHKLLLLLLVNYFCSL